MSLFQAVMYPLARAKSEPVLKAATLPGRTSSCSAAPRSGRTMRTVGTVWALVQAATSCLLLARSVMPKKARPAAPTARTQRTAKMRPVLGLGGVAGDSEDIRAPDQACEGSPTRGSPALALALFGLTWCAIENTVGTNNSVAQVANVRPPM